MKPFDRLESEVRLYSRTFPVVFNRGIGSTVFDEQNRPYIDFFSGAGALNYGHNNPRLKRRLIEYLDGDGITHSLDMATTAKGEFLERFERIILAPRNLEYKVQFCGPTGANAVEAALKLARKITGRQVVVYFMNAYHGLSLGALAVTGSRSKRASSGAPLCASMPLPFDGDLGPTMDSLDYFEKLLDNSQSGLDLPAAVIVETIQAEGGVKPARAEWLRHLEEITNQHGIILIVDDIQVGCGRTGSFFSFESVGINPDLVCLSKSVSGFGLPMSLLLIRPERDLWNPGEHTGTFRGNNLAFVTAAEALAYWEDDSFSDSIREKSRLAKKLLNEIAMEHLEARGWVRGCGLIQGLGFDEPGLAQKICRAAFKRGLLVECSGPQDEVIKILPPLTISEQDLTEGIAIIADAAEATLSDAGLRSLVAPAS
jgi:diaminobutyrate-2-oxoglutarate transaminase